MSQIIKPCSDNIVKVVETLQQINAEGKSVNPDLKIFGFCNKRVCFVRIASSITVFRSKLKAYVIDSYV